MVRWFPRTIRGTSSMLRCGPNYQQISRNHCHVHKTHSVIIVYSFRISLYPVISSQHPAETNPNQQKKSKENNPIEIQKQKKSKPSPGKYRASLKNPHHAAAAARTTTFFDKGKSNKSVSSRIAEALQEGTRTDTETAEEARGKASKNS